MQSKSLGNLHFRFVTLFLAISWSLDVYSCDSQEIYKAISQEDDSSLQQLLESPFNLECLYKSQTPLQWAVEKNNSIAVGLLLDKNVDLEEDSITKVRPLSMSILYKREAILKQLLLAGAFVSDKDYEDTITLKWPQGKELIRKVWAAGPHIDSKVEKFCHYDELTLTQKISYQLRPFLYKKMHNCIRRQTAYYVFAGYTQLI